LQSPLFIAAQDSCDKQFVVSQVNLPATSGLSASDQALIRVRVIGHCFDEQQLEQIAGQILGTLQSIGYLRATVSEPTITITDVSRHPQPVSLNVELKEGPHYRVSEIEIWNNVLPYEQIKSVYQIQLGDFLDMSKVVKTAEALRKVYVANGYQKALVVPQVRFDNGLVGVAFKVVEAAPLP
jgi:outer membrane protein assembly factor BamA